jgi:hypothetical protein
VQLLAIAVSARWGLLAVAWAIGLAQLVALPVALAQLGRLSGIAPAAMARALAPVSAVYLLALGVTLVGPADRPMLAVADAIAFVATMLVLAALLLRRPWRFVSGAVRGGTSDGVDGPAVSTATGRA